MRLDTPEWARRHRFMDVNIFHDLGHLSDIQSLADNEFFVMEFRPYLAKTSRTTGYLYGRWVTFIENRFMESCCIVKAVINYLAESKELDISTSVKVDKNFTINDIPDDKGKNSIAAKPVLISLSGSPRIGLQPNTISGIVRRRIIQPLGITGYTPYILRATSASYKIGYGCSIASVLKVGDWSSEEAFYKHYYFSPLVRGVDAQLR